MKNKQKQKEKMERILNVLSKCVPKEKNKLMDGAVDYRSFVVRNQENVQTETKILWSLSHSANESLTF